MKKSLTVVCALLGVCTVIAIVVAILGFVYDILALGIIGCIAAVVSLWFFAGMLYRDVVYNRVVACFDAKDFAKAREILDRAERNQFFYPIVRVLVFQLGLRTAIGLDDTTDAVRYIESLRSLGGNEGGEWRYKTAYFLVMINLDWGDISAARAEYSDFSDACENLDNFQEQLGILDAVFAHIDGEEAELPEAAERSEYPVVHRVLQKYC